MSRARALRVLAASKRIDRPLDTWLVEITRGLRGLLDRGDGAIAVPFGYETSGLRRLRCVTPAEQELDPTRVGAYHARVTELLPAIEAREYLAATVTMRQPFSPLSRIVRQSVFAGARTAARELLPGAVDFLGMRIADPATGRGVLLSGLESERAVLGTPRERLLAALARCIQSDFRLRTSLGADPASCFASAGAVFTGEGRVLHATDDAAAALPAGRALARWLDSARHTAPAAIEEVVAIWHGLLAGEWTILNLRDDGGEDLWVLHRMPDTAPRLRALSALERFALLRRVDGAGVKTVAREADVTVSAIQTRLSTARRKLGVEHWPSLARFVRSLPPHALTRALARARRDLAETAWRS